jgi:hypothetical protein
MKPFIYFCTLFVLLFLLNMGRSQAQCTNANVNWDNLDFLVTAGNYSPWVTATMQQNQRFAIGRSALTLTHNYSAANSLGENTTHTGEASSNGTGADVEFRGNGTITITFDAPVTNVLFSLYDVDRSQRVDVDAFDGATGRNVLLGVTASSILTIFNNNSTTAYATASSQTRAVNSTHATLNVSIAGPVTSVVITVSATGTCSSSCGAGGNENGQFWLSDIQACVTGSFPNNYYTVSQPFTGQPSWVLVVHDLNTVYMVDPATGRAVSLFTDADPRVREINGIAYDPHKRIIYYTVDGLERCVPAGNPDSIRHIKKYDVNTETISSVISNVNDAPFRIPTFDYGLESGGAAFYNGSLYMGVEGYFLNSVSPKNSGRETIIWRIDFAADSITPTQASQVWAIPTDNGTSNTHDWADFVIRDGVLINTNSSVNAVGGSGRGLYYHVNMQTNVTTTTVNPNASADRPTQIAQGWNGTLYWTGNQIGVYNATAASTVTSKQTIFHAPRSVTWVGPAGDAAEAFRPKADFGDAPASYDPVALSPALHERDTALRIGNYGWEWTKHVSANAAGDPDEDGISVVPLLSTGGGGYLVPVRVWNNTGVNANLLGWLDYNGNGVFDAGEASASVTVSSAATLQTVNLTWASTPNSFNVGDYTFLRVRLTSSAMTSSNATGYFPDGEVEDYRVWVGEYPLDVKMISFDAKGMNNKTAYLKWQTTAEENFDRFEVERSANGSQWVSAGVVKSKGTGTSSINNYSFTDLQPYRGQTFYRLKLIDANGQFQYSEIRSVTFKDFVEQFTISPNPARDKAVVTMQANSSFTATLLVTDFTGRTVRKQAVQLNPGINRVEIVNAASLQNGMYVVQLVSGEMKITGKLLINH